MKRSRYLRKMFTSFIVVLVILIVILTSVPLGYQMVSHQRAFLIYDLGSRANVLLGALSSEATVDFRNDSLGLASVSDLPRLRLTMKEATNATITGRPSNGWRGTTSPHTPRASGPDDGKDYVWVSDEKRFTEEI